MAVPKCSSCHKTGGELEGMLYADNLSVSHLAVHRPTLGHL